MIATNAGRAPVVFDDVVMAARRLAGVVHRTPVMTSRDLDRRAGCRVFLKCENFQRAGAFKIRGAFNAMSQLSEDEKRCGVITYSSGNHAQAIALAGSLLGVPALVVMPADAPSIKAEATKAYGAEVVFYNPQTEEREAVAEKLGAGKGMTLIPPFDHPQVIAGQGTAALEMMEQVGDLDLMLAPCGGGGLLSGSAIALKGRLPEARIIGVEPEGADNGNRAYRSGKIERIEQPRTFADGLRPKALGEHTFQIIRRCVDGMVTVSEDEIRATLDFLCNRMKLVVEPSAAVGLAPLFHGKLGATGSRVAVIISGGNADIDAVARWFRAEKA